MKTIVIYDDNGEIYMTQSGDNVTAENGANITETEIPDGYTVSSVNTETGEPVLEAIPKTAEQLRLEALEEQMNALIGVNESEGAV